MPTGLVETRTITSISSRVITVSSAFSEAPNAQSVYLIQTNDVQSNQFRVISVVEGDDGTYAVTALQYNQSIYDAVERDLDLTQRDITNLSGVPDPVSDITGEEYLYEKAKAHTLDLALAGPHQQTVWVHIGFLTELMTTTTPR